MRAFQDLQGKEVALGRFLGRGGEGAVYALPTRPRLVAKVYARTPRDPMGHKLTAMVQLGTDELAASTAWPQDLLLDERSGSVVGFLMPRVEDHRGIHALYGPTNRNTAFPDATWDFLVRAAGNVAATFDTVHQHGHVIGDVNEGNIVVSQKATIRLIDCDSLQITHLGRTYPCRVGVPLYTPPELQGKRLEDVVRTPDHDRFGLAVLVFQLLFMGRHPFAGRHPGRAIPVEAAIREGLFAFGWEAARQGWEPPPFSLRITDVPPPIAQLFERGFEGHATAGRPRPTAAEWVTALGELEAMTVICGKDPRHVHAKANDSCPWCRIEKEGGPSFFLPLPQARGMVDLSGEDREFIDEHLAEGRVFRKYGLHDKAADQFLAVVARFPDNLEARQELRDVFKDRGDKDKAAEQSLALAEICRLKGDAEGAKIRMEARKSVVLPGGEGPVEQELFRRMARLALQARKSFAAVPSKLTAEERGRVQSAMDRSYKAVGQGADELQVCVEALEDALRVLESARIRG